MALMKPRSPTSADGDLRVVSWRTQECSLTETRHGDMEKERNTGRVGDGLKDRLRKTGRERFMCIL